MSYWASTIRLPVSSASARTKFLRSRSIRSAVRRNTSARSRSVVCGHGPASNASRAAAIRSEEHTSELQSRGHLVCRLLLETKNKEYKLTIPQVTEAKRKNFV